MAALGAAALLAAPALRAQGACDGRPIHSIRVVATSLFAPSDPDVLGLARAAGESLHIRTRDEVVRRELLFRVGDPCDPARLAESARVLRAQPFIREATVRAVPAAGGGADVVVTTRDEWSLRLSGRVQGGAGFPVRRARIAEENVGGGAVAVALRYDGLQRRPAYDADVAAHQFLGRFEAEVTGGRSSVGPVFEERLLQPFKSVFDRSAWRESARYRKEPFSLVAPAFGRVDVPLLDVSADLGAAIQSGTPSRLFLFGSALSAERLLAQGSPLASIAADDSLAAAAVAGRFAERRRIRIHGFAALRSLRFRPHVGLDAVHAYEDAREGIEAGLVVGKSLFSGNGLQPDWFAAGELFVGAEHGPMVAFARGKIEGRYLLTERRWEGILADGRFFLYTEVGPRSFVILTAGGASGWNTRTPFQLTLAGPDGIRGYGLAGLPVGRRFEVSAEHRYFLGTWLGVADVGTAAFVDMGRGWAGDALFGADTGLLVAVGAGLRIAAPRGSRRTYRVDLALPLGAPHRVELQVTVNQQFGVFRGEPQDMARSREQVSSSTIFTYPRF